MSLIDREKLLEELKVFQRTNIYLSVKDLITNAPSIEEVEQNPFGYWLEGEDLDESDYFPIKDFPDLDTNGCIALFTKPPQPQSVKSALEKAAKICKTQEEILARYPDNLALAEQCRYLKNEILALIEKE